MAFFILAATNPFHKFFHSTLHKNEDESFGLSVRLEREKKYFFSRYKHILQPPGYFKSEAWHRMVLVGHKKGRGKKYLLTLVNPSWRMSEIFLHRITLVIFLLRSLLPSPLINLCPTNFSTPLMMVVEDVKGKRDVFISTKIFHTPHE